MFCDRIYASMISKFSNSRRLFFFTLVFLLVFFASAKSSSASHTSGDVTGTILPGFTSAKLLSDDTDVDFGCISCNVQVTATGLTGYADAQTSGAGFINLNYSGPSIQVLNDGAGDLSGSGWCDGCLTVGWLNFESANPLNDVVINSSGEFFGYAWMDGPGKGWVEFFCPGDSCVKTDWHQAVASTGGGPSGSYVPIIYGVCGSSKNNVPTETEPSGSLCSSGSQQGPVSVTENGEITGWKWQCLGSATCTGEGCNVNCSAPRLVPGEEPETPVEEICGDELDNDLDGFVDEGCPPGPVELPGEEVEVPEGPEGEPPGPVDLPEVPEETPPGPPTALCPGLGCPTEPPEGELPGEVGIVDQFTDPITNILTNILGGTLSAGIIVGLANALGALAGLGTLAGVFSGTLNYLLGIGLNAANLRAVFARSSYNFLTFLGIKKKSYIWGTVFDADTLIGLDPAYVVLHDASGAEIDTRITDINGRYGFTVENPGTYYISANKVDYGWPSRKLAGKQSHEIYDKLYFGEPIVIEKPGDVIAKDIPMDALKINWNEIAKNERGYVSKWVKKDIWTNRLSGVLFTSGFLIALVALFSSPTTFNFVMLGVYALILVLRRAHILKPSYKAALVSKTDKFPIPFAVIKVFSLAGVQVARAVSNQLGRYFLLVSPGRYYVTIERKNPAGVYEKIYQSEPFAAKKIINKTFKM